jgi:putative toxin-antitoxin system antitoxin component (TIGR02293 family)
MSTTLKKAKRRKGTSKQRRALTGVVNWHIHRSSSNNGELSPGRLIEVIGMGLPMDELEVLRASLDVPMEKLAAKLGISVATIQRRKLQGRLEAGESDRVVRFARLMGKAVTVFGNEQDAREWLSAPQFGLGGAVPLDYAKTEVGAREVENLLGRIEHGVYS